MAQEQQFNELYLMVLPTVSLSDGKVDQILTLIGDKNLATEFFPDEVSTYISMFKNRTKYFQGGHVLGYELNPEDTESERVVVRVKQIVG